MFPTNIFPVCLLNFRLYRNPHLKSLVFVRLGLLSIDADYPTVNQSIKLTIFESKNMHLYSSFLRALPSVNIKNHQYDETKNPVLEPGLKLSRREVWLEEYSLEEYSLQFFDQCKDNEISLKLKKWWENMRLKLSRSYSYRMKTIVSQLFSLLSLSRVSPNRWASFIIASRSVVRNPLK